MEAGSVPAAGRGTAVGCDTTVECNATAAACGVAAAASSVAAGCVPTVECGAAAAASGVAAAACGVAAAACGVAVGCVTTTGSTRTVGCGLAGDSRGTLEAAPEAAGDIAPAAFEEAPEAPEAPDNIEPAAFEEAPEAPDNIAPAAFDKAPEAPDDVALVTLEIAPEEAGDVAVSIGKRASLVNVPDRKASSSFAITVEFAVVVLIRPIIYFANSVLNFEAFDDSANFCSCGTTGSWIGVAVSSNTGFTNNFAEEIDAGIELVTPEV